MIFINPKTDFAFKKIFGSTENKDILISFLNALLYQGNDTIQDLEILNPYLAPRIRGVKDTYLDVKAKLDGGETVVIEMQVLNVEGFEKRILYNAAKAYSIQLGKGVNYTLLNPVIALTITDFEMFPHLNSVISRFVLKEKDYLVDYLIYDIELVFAELPKFNKSLEELDSLTDKWLYFMKHTRQLSATPEPLETVPAIQHAFTVANQANLSPEELDELEHQEMFIHDQRNAVKKAVRLAVEEATEKALEEGKQEGRQEGIALGKEESQIEIAQRLLGILDEETISQTTGLPLETVRSLRQEEA